ncbi:acetate uptake transporter [Bacillus sp. 165]|uniref:acetate uptake transporter n=1 Tax=Bacillus sp. 165 TaxID=1529117 RepID=UPI001ADA729F|nr:acetate uptake transporter [Bacillus sp. 165]MBO9129033.1 acetate uptake transporter [Bacillus sp. 165]
MNEAKKVRIDGADGTPLGLLGFAMITLLSSSEKFGWTEGISFILPWAIFLGGFAQLFAALQDVKHKNTFGATIFGGFALYWFAVGVSWLIQLGVFGETLANNVDTRQLGIAIGGYLIFTLSLTIGAAETNKVLFVNFILIDILLLSLFLISFNVATTIFRPLAAYSEFIISLLSFYGCMASVLNNHFEYTFLPVGKPLGVFKKLRRERHFQSKTGS